MYGGVTWSGLGQPFCFVLPPDKSAPGKHNMPSLFVRCQDATVTVNGRALPGKPVPREIAVAHHCHGNARLVRDLDPLLSLVRTGAPRRGCRRVRRRR